jgi:thiamine-monophosphate kinase
VLFRDETEFVRWLRRRWPERPSGLRLGIGDDAAVIRVRGDSDLVLTTDLSLEGVHFRRDLHPPRALGHRALARALSDLAAMGARPRFALISLALSQDTRRHWVRAFYDGLGALARRHRVTVIGGDTAVVAGGIMVDVVAVGEVARGRALGRAGACPGDGIYVSGRLGLSALGLSLLRSRARSSALSPSAERAAIQAHLYPEPRLRLGQHLSRRRLASAAIDVSDGLVQDLARLCRASGCGARIREAALPLGEPARGCDPLELALDGGEDYELLFTVPRSRVAGMAPAAAGVPIHAIGEMRRQRGVVLVGGDGREMRLEARGYDHFRNSG